MPLLKNGFLEKIETWHVGLSCQCTHFMSFSSKSEHDTVADQATLKGLTMIFASQENPFIIFRSKEIYICFKTNNKIPINLMK